MVNTNNLENIVQNTNNKKITITQRLKEVYNIFEGKDTITEKFLAIYTLPTCIPLCIIAKLVKKYY